MSNTSIENYVRMLEAEQAIAAVERIRSKRKAVYALGSKQDKGNGVGSSSRPPLSRPSLSSCFELYALGIGHCSGFRAIKSFMQHNYIAVRNWVGKKIARYQL